MARIWLAIFSQYSAPRSPLSGQPMTVITMPVDFGPGGHQLCQANPAGSTAMKLVGNIGRAMVWSLNSAPAASETGRSAPQTASPRLRGTKRKEKSRDGKRDV